jgi:hypothetical protein
MLNRTEIERLAQAANAHRPDWPVKSLCTWLMADHAHRPLRDVAVALAWIATDPGTKTPKRMNEAGPWWTAVRATSSDSHEPLRFPRCSIDGHTSYRADNCGACRADWLAKDTRAEYSRRESCDLNNHGPSTWHPDPGPRDPKAPSVQ